MKEAKKEYLKSIEPETPLLLRAAILSYEVGAITRAMVYASRFTGTKDAYLAAAQTDIGDAIVQLELLCSQLGFSFYDTMDMGWEHLAERYKDFEQDGWAKVQ